MLSIVPSFWKLEVGSWKLEVGSWKLEVGSWKLEVGSWKLEVGSCSTVNKLLIFALDFKSYYSIDSSGGSMEEKSGASTHFTGVIRLVIFIVLVVVLVVFVVRWASNRRAERKAEEAVKTAQDAQKEASKDTSKDHGTTEASGSQTTQVPGGVAESNAPLEANQRVPNTGIEERVPLVAVGLGAVTYLFVRNRQTRKSVRLLS